MDSTPAYLAITSHQKSQDPVCVWIDSITMLSNSPNISPREVNGSYRKHNFHLWRWNVYKVVKQLHMQNSQQ